MPRSSEKQRYITQLYQTLCCCLQERVFWMSNGDDNSVEDMKELALSIMIRNAESRRYLFCPTKCQKAPHDRFVLGLPLEEDIKNMEVDSDDEKEVQPWLNDMEFLQKHRMSRKNFDKILLSINCTKSWRNAK